MQMNEAGLMHALGLVRRSDGSWQSARVQSDGHVLTSVTAGGNGFPSDEPQDIIGLDGGSHEEIPAGLAGRFVTDFRQADLKMGGQGDPLIAVYLHALLRHLDATQPWVFLDAGETCQLTWVDPAISDPADPAGLMVFDAGPGPLLGNIDARNGTVVDGALELFLDDPYFRKLPPKRVTKHNFEQMLALVSELALPDQRATIMGMSATSVMLAMEFLPKRPQQIVLFQTPDPLFLNMLCASVDVPVVEANAVGVDGATLDAQAIAFLAIRVAKGLPTTFPNTTGVAAAVGGGSITDFS